MAAHILDSYYRLDDEGLVDELNPKDAAMYAASGALMKTITICTADKETTSERIEYFARVVPFEDGWEFRFLQKDNPDRYCIEGSYFWKPGQNLIWKDLGSL